MSRVEAFSRDARTSGAVLVVEGDPGVGKSRLLQTAVDRAVAGGDASFRCAEQNGRERSVSGPAPAPVPLPRPLRDPRTTAPRRVARLSRAREWASSSPLRCDRRHRRLRQGLASATPVLVIADDVHWVDRPRRTSRSLARNVLGAPIALLVAVRSTLHPCSITSRCHTYALLRRIDRTRHVCSPSEMTPFPRPHAIDSWTVRTGTRSPSWRTGL